MFNHGYVQVQQQLARRNRKIANQHIVPNPIRNCEMTVSNPKSSIDETEAKKKKKKKMLEMDHKNFNVHIVNQNRIGFKKW